MTTVHYGRVEKTEKGSWTPVVVGNTTSGTGTYNWQIGTYSKVGDEVRIYFNIEWTAHTGTGPIKITGLPYASAATMAAVALYINNFAFTAGAHLQAYVSGSSIFLMQASPGGAASGVPMTTGQISGSCSYWV